MPSVSLAPYVRQQFFNTNGTPLSGGKIYSYQAGTTTPQATYTDSSGATPNSNPIILDSAGVCRMWLDQSLSYKIVVKDSSDNQLSSEDGIIGLTTDDAVATNSIQDSAITTAKIADDAVTAAKLRDDASIDANRAVTTNHLRDALINSFKLDGTTTSSFTDILNMSLSASVSSNAMTIALKTRAGADASATDPIIITFRSSTATSGIPVRRSIASAKSVVISSGSTMGSTNGNAGYVYVYAIDNAGTVELAVSGSKFFDSGSVVTTTAEGGGGAADSKYTLYSTTARTGVGIVLLGRIKSTQTTAGTWAASPSEISLYPFEQNSPRSYVFVYGGATSATTGMGSTNTWVRRFLSTDTNIGTAITYADSATLGGSFTINEEGLYNISYWDQASGATLQPIITKNSTTLTANAIAFSIGTTMDTLTGAVGQAHALGVPLSVGDVIRAQDGAATNRGAQAGRYIGFIISKVSN